MGLREETAEKHRIAEQKEFNQRMFRGELTKEEYVEYLKIQLIIFYVIETKFKLPHDGLKRYEKVMEDLVELGHETVYIHGELDYANYLLTLNDGTILPHIYLNYLALAYGGQMMKSKVPGSGRMYDFDNMMECVGSIRAVQKDEWAEEVNKGFDFLIDIFDGLQNTTRPNGE